MKFRRITGVLLALTIVMAMSVTAFGALVYDAAADLSSGLRGQTDYIGYQDEIVDGSGRIALAGGIDLFYWSDAKGLKISDRTADWNSIDILLEGLDGEYTLVVEFAADDSVTFQIVDADSPYGTHIEASGTEATIEYTFTAVNGKHDAQNRLRMRAAGTDTYYIKSVLLYDADGPEAVGGPAEGAGNAKTGVSDMLVVSGIVLLFAIGAMTVIRRRAVNHN